MAYFETPLGPSTTTVARISVMRLCLDGKAIRRSSLSEKQNIDLRSVHGGRDKTCHTDQKDQPGLPSRSGHGHQWPAVEWLDRLKMLRCMALTVDFALHSTYTRPSSSMRSGQGERFAGDGKASSSELCGNVVSVPDD